MEATPSQHIETHPSIYPSGVIPTIYSRYLLELELGLLQMDFWSNSSSTSCISGPFKLFLGLFEKKIKYIFITYIIY